MLGPKWLPAELAWLTITMVWLKCVSVTFARRVLWLCPGHIQPYPGHIQLCPRHIYNCTLDTFYKRVVDIFKYVSLPHLYMEKRQKY